MAEGWLASNAADQAGAEFVRLKVDVMATTSGSAGIAVKKATSSCPDCPCGGERPRRARVGYEFFKAGC